MPKFPFSRFANGAAFRIYDYDKNNSPTVFHTVGECYVYCRSEIYSCVWIPDNSYSHLYISFGVVDIFGRRAVIVLKRFAVKATEYQQYNLVDKYSYRKQEVFQKKCYYELVSIFFHTAGADYCSDKVVAQEYYEREFQQRSYSPPPAASSCVVQAAECQRNCQQIQ